MATGVIISQRMMLELIDFKVFNMSLGVFFYGVWLGPRELKIFIEDVDGATPPSLPCDAGAVACVGEGSTRIGRFLASGNLRSLPRVTAPVVALAPKLSGSFGVSTLQILSVVAYNGVANSTKNVFGASDFIGHLFCLFRSMCRLCP